MTDYALRGEVADAIREYCHSVSPAAVQMSRGTERIYYAGISLDGLTDAIAAAIEARGVAQAAWQPIETVPENHFTVLVYGKYGRLTAFRDVAWQWWPFPAGEPLDYTPTHWMPLPEAPVVSSTHQRETYCEMCDREHQLHEDAQGFHHVIRGERVACPLSPASQGGAA